MNVTIQQLASREHAARAIVSGQPDSVRRILDCVLAEEFAPDEWDRIESRRERLHIERHVNDSTRMVAQALSDIIRKIAAGEIES